MWGKATEEVDDVPGQEPPTTENAPLLQSYKTKWSEKTMDGTV